MPNLFTLRHHKVELLIPQSIVSYTKGAKLSRSPVILLVESSLSYIRMREGLIECTFIEWFMTDLLLYH